MYESAGPALSTAEAPSADEKLTGGDAASGVEAEFGSGGWQVEIHEIDPRNVDPCGGQCEDWLRLFEQDSDVPVTLHPEHVQIELRRLHAARPGRGWTVRVSQEGQPVGLAVLLPKTINARNLLGYGPRFCWNGFRLAGGMLLGQPGDEASRRLLAAVVQLVREQRADFLLVEDLAEATPLWAELTALRGEGYSVLLPRGLQQRHLIRFPEIAEEYWAKFSSVSRKTHRRTIKKIQPATLLRVTEPEQVPQFLADVRHISARSWQARHLGTRISDDADLADAYLFLARQGALRSYVLYQAQRPIAFEIAWQYNGRYYAEEAGYDLEFARLSPGQAHFLLTLEDLIAHDTPAIYDFGSGDGEYKQHFGNDTMQSGSLLIVPPGCRTRLIAGYIRAGLAAHSGVKNLLAVTGYQGMVRRWIRRQG